MKIFAPPFVLKSLILFQPSKQESKFIFTLLNTMPYKSSTIDIYIARNNTDIEQNIKQDPSAIIILCKDVSFTFYKTIFDLGAFATISLNNFIASFVEYTSQKVMVRNERVLIAFLPNNLASIIAHIFLLYGFSVTVVNHQNTFSEELPKANYLIMDQDLSSLDIIVPNALVGIRKKIIEEIINRQKQVSKISVSVIKDFTKGSLASDVLSPIKGICNILLSPLEYIHFIIQYLELIIFQKDFEIKMNTIRPIDLSTFTTTHLQRELFKQLKDPKKIYYNVETKRGDIDKFLTAYQNIAEDCLRFKQWKLFIEWLEYYCSKEDEMNNRASFSDINGNVETEVLLRSLIAKDKDKSFQQKKVSPQDTSNSPNSP